jgi:hypothetical protein
MKPTPMESLEWVSWLYCAAMISLRIWWREDPFAPVHQLSTWGDCFSNPLRNRKTLMKLVTNIRPLSSRVQILDEVTL